MRGRCRTRSGIRNPAVRAPATSAAGRLGKPEIALTHILHVGATLRVQHRDPAVAIGHVGPFRRLVPVQFADAARAEAHVDAGDSARDREVGLRHLARPAPALDALVRVVEGGPELRQLADVRGRRIDRIRKLRLKRRITRPRVGESAWAAVDGSFRRLVRISECGGMRRTGCKQAPPAAATASMSRRDRKLVAPLSGRSGTALSAGSLLIGMISSTVALMATNASQFHSTTSADGTCARMSRNVVMGSGWALPLLPQL